MRTMRQRKGGAFAVHTCPHCGRKTRGPSHFRHVQACRREARRRPMATGRRRASISRRGHARRSGQPLRQFFTQLRRLVQQEIQQQLGVA